MLSSLQIKDKAHELGFDACGIAPAADLPELQFFQEWLARGYAGSMRYLHRSAARRADVRNVVPSARTVIVVGTNYHTDRPFSIECQDAERAHIARYAWGDDYHDVILVRLLQLLHWMRETSSEPFDARAYVDTGPIQERVYAQHAGIGWIGKNTCVINPSLGSWLLLGEIVCSLDLEADPPALDQCGTCSLCIEACPTQALIEPHVLDSTRCISYLTIELRGEIPNSLRTAIGTHAYGCDVCQEVCPWNSVAPLSNDSAWQPRPVWDLSSVTALSTLSDAELEKALSGSAMQRAKVTGLRRNISIACENAAAKRHQTSEKLG
ncbi:MAG: tRNA epoxyqueuosine(34) reductase QueG [Blastocatellia bacterium]|nr:MAG: tRNA epoxyqueuosine(34) reductase QueG [Blastocatellia bacterium]